MTDFTPLSIFLKHPATPENTLPTPFKHPSKLSFFPAKIWTEKINRDFIKEGRGGGSILWIDFTKKIFYFMKDCFPYKIFRENVWKVFKVSKCLCLSLSFCGQVMYQWIWDHSRCIICRVYSTSRCDLKIVLPCIPFIWKIRFCPMGGWAWKQ